MSQVTVLQCDRCREVAKPEKAVDWRAVEIRIADGSGGTAGKGSSLYRRWEHLCGSCLAIFREVVGTFDRERAATNLGDKAA